ncbi:type I phosphomannose isomerase catalytic subunit [Lentilactobacillus raoultii]|uniref:Mannose-6-phosphate isomerase n=1 Tax=Lentilactobacillus raoultii TaxID=1987503 RepID=A0ABW3PWE2_9LACO|nr:type I phosphomannose isomerase catalytic subunit [Lentilactobacillus raoultii]
MDLKAKRTPLFLSAVLHQKIWGGTKLQDYGFKLPSDHTGEAWLISAHPHGLSRVNNGPLAGQTLTKIWREFPELFGGHAQDAPFPLLVKLLDAKDNLSIQVHPDDDYARAHGERFGKAESWYILSAAPGAKIYYGHRAKTKAALQAAIDAGQIETVLRTIPVKTGDFFYNPAGVLHALGAGIVALETQQSSDMTFRFYDFDRLDPTTHKKRPLQLQNALAVTQVPHQDPHIVQATRQVAHGMVTMLVNADDFVVEKIQTTGELALNQAHNYLLQTVVDGGGELIVDGTVYPVKKGTSYILPKPITSYRLSGLMTVIASYAK